SSQDGGQLPTQVERILHGDIHALPRLRAMRVAGITGDEDARLQLADLLFRYIIEPITEPLANLIDRPPGDLFYIQRIRVQDALCRCDQVIRCDVPARNPLAFGQLVEFDIEPEQVSALARNDQDAAFFRRLDQ